MFKSQGREEVKLIPSSTTTGLKVPFSTALNPQLLQWSQRCGGGGGGGGGGQLPGVTVWSWMNKKQDDAPN